MERNLFFNSARSFIQDSLEALARPSLRRDAFLSVLLTAIVGTLALFYVVLELGKQADLAKLMDSAGRLRMLSQRTASVTHRAVAGDAAFSAHLPELRAQLDQGLLNVEAKGYEAGLFRGEDKSLETLRLVKQRWREYHDLTSHLVKAATTRTLSQEESEQIDIRADALLDAADSLTKVILGRFSEKREQFGGLLPFALFFGLLLSLTTFIYNYFRIQQPLARIGQMFDRIAAGDLSARAEVGRRDEFGQIIDSLNHSADVFQALQGEQELAAQMIRDSELRNRTLWEVSADAIVMIDAQGTIRYTNPAVFEILGYSPREILGQNIAILQPPHLQEGHRLGFSRYMEHRERRINWTGVELSVVARDGREMPVELSFAHMSLSGQDWFVGFFRDISQRVAAQADLRIRERAIESTGEGVMITDSRAKGYPIIYVNPALERITGYASEELIGRSGRIFLSGDRNQVGVVELRLLLRERREGTVEIQGYRKNGRIYWIELSVAPVRDTQGDVTHYVSVFKDVTERKAHEAALLQSATYDALTGLPNRSLLHDRLTQAIAAAERHQRELGVLFIDLDHFKWVNDSLGHDFGDQLLVAVAERLRTDLRDGDTVARWGGDEFVILLVDLELREDIALVAQRLLDKLNQPMILEGQTLYCAASIGGSVFPKDGQTVNELLQHADIAMYGAKGQGRNTCRFYAGEMQQGIDRHLAMVTQLRTAVDKGELFLHYQPQIELATGRVIGAEALIRWRHPEFGMVSPAMFIPVAEDSGLILEIGDWVLHTACAEARRWKQMGLHELCVAINLSARQFLLPDLPARIGGILECHGLQGGDIEVEITEGLVMGNPTRTIDTLQQLNALGIRTALDDFGTGYSSLAYLKNFPVSRLKIDKSFVKDEAIVHAVIQLALSYQLETVAEGVEDEETLGMLRRLGCNIVQGYYYARPLPAEDFVEFVRRREAISIKGEMHASGME